MKRIRPDYYDKFACIADQCSITCCQEWKIGVDADTNRKWKKIFPPEDVSPQKKNLSAYTTKKDGGRVIELTEEHKCPFLNENKLCRPHMEITCYRKPAQYFRGKYTVLRRMRKRH